ncbi:MAG: 1,4-alpha-glucan branching protein GlgB [Lachnospiraceae bacterium]
MQKERVFISETDQYLFATGTHYEIYKKMGAHSSVENDVEGVYFAVWAPNAVQVFVSGDFNEWHINSHPMELLGPGGIWAVFVPYVKEGTQYKFVIQKQSGEFIYKADPFANYAQLRPETASIVASLDFKWSDSIWMNARKEIEPKKSPMAVYECHIASFMNASDGGEYTTYREFANRIIPYLKKLKFTHIELMGIAEYPYDGSWGYQVTGYYAPTSRYGTPADFKYLINQLHRNKIGVILDWVPAHFTKDAHGLAEFDGTCVFEHPDPRLGEHLEWGTKVFNYSKYEVSNFLIANALFWIEEFHIDGLRVDAVASMLYLDYGKEDGQWVANKYGGNQNLEAIEFFRHLNSVIKNRGNGAITIAEESTAWSGVTKDPQEGGLGFTFKWNMGWMNDFCEYMKLDPLFRKNSHYNMTFAMSYNESENYVLPLSHDEVVHLKCSMLEKMPGYEVDKFANLRCGYAYMFGHSGKKLLFMGQEFGQRREWSEERELDWFLLEQPIHQGMLDFVAELLKIYRKYPCMYEKDTTWDGFEWMNADDLDRSTYSFVRKTDSDKKNLLFVINFTPIPWSNYKMRVPVAGKYKLVLNSDEVRFGGNGTIPKNEIKTHSSTVIHGRHEVTLDVPAYTALVYAY